MAADLSTNRRYSIRLVNEEGGITLADVAWAIDVDRLRAADAILEILVMKEKDPDGYKGKVVIEDADSGSGQGCVQDYRDRRYEPVQGTGRDRHVDIGNFAHRTIESLRSPQAAEKSYAQRQLEDSSMVGVCCSDPAITHSKLWPFKCRALGCRCQGWDSGE